MRQFFKKIIAYLIQGMIIVSPIGLVIYIILLILTSLEEILPKLLVGLDKFIHLFTDEVSLSSFYFPGLGLLTLFFLLILIGYFARFVIAVPLASFFNWLLDKSSPIKTLYYFFKDLFSAIAGKKKKFDKPVLVKLSADSNLERIGFVTNEDVSSIGISNDKVMVYIPHSYAWSGNMFIVSRDCLTPIQSSSADIMKLIISGGVAAIKE